MPPLFSYSFNLLVQILRVARIDMRYYAAVFVQVANNIDGGMSALAALCGDGG